MREIHILFIGIGRRIELVQSFRLAALVLHKTVKIYGEDLTTTAPAITYCDCYRNIVPIRHPDYINDLLKVCIEDKIDIVIPTIDTCLLLLAENRKKFEEIGTKVLISDPDKVLICRDKNKTSQFFVDCGVKAPLPVNNWKQYKLGFPAFIKPKDGSSSINAYKVENASELEVYAEQIKDYVIQPFVSGREYTIDIFCDWEGKPISIVPRERLQVRAGEVLKTRICLDKTMIDEAKAICKSFKPCGPITIQLIRDDEGIDWFIEINPRYGGGAPLSMKAGARSAETILKLLDGEPLDPQRIADNAVYSRFDQSVCVEEGKRNIKGVIFDLDDTLYSEKEYVRSGFKAVSEFLGGGYEDKLWGYFIEGKVAITELLKDIDRLGEDQTCLNIYRSHKPNIHLYDGVVNLMSELKARGIKVGIITDGRPVGQRNKLEALGLWNIVDDVIITDELGGVQFRKPCDIAFRIMITKWRLNPSDIVYIGDNASKDFQAPQQLGLKSICLQNKEGLYFNDNYVNNLNISTIERLSDFIGCL